MRDVLLVGLGGFLGAIFRYGLSGAVHLLVRTFDFPYGTLTVNVIGSLALGFLVATAESLGIFGPAFRLVFFVGLLGSFTTFSTFSFETSALMLDGQVGPAALNVAANVILCLFAAWIGRSIVLWIWR